MGIPHTLSAMLGFALLAGFLISEVYAQDSVAGDVIAQLQNDLEASIKETLNADSVFDSLNFVSVIWTSVSLLLTYILTFVGYSSSLPSEFAIFFMIFFMMFCVAIIKLVRGVWDY